MALIRRARWWYNSAKAARSPFRTPRTSVPSVAGTSEPPSPNPYLNPNALMAITILVAAGRFLSRQKSGIMKRICGLPRSGRSKWVTP
jgi:hypothetical protein